MTKVLVLYYSSFGHTEKMAEAIAEGARETGAKVSVKRVRETAPKEIVESAGFKTDSDHPECDVEELPQYDAIVIGTPTRYGNMCSQMQAFWDATASIWQKGKLVGKVGGGFTSTASQHGGNESTLFAIHKTLLHQGMVVVGLPYAFKGMLTLDEVTGGTPYGASTIAGAEGERQPTANELDGARFQGRHIAEIAEKLA